MATKKKEPTKKPTPKKEEPTVVERVLAHWDDDLIGKEFKKEWLSDPVRVGQLHRFVVGMHGRINDSTFFIRDEEERRKATDAIRKEQSDIAWEIARSAPPAEDIELTLSQIALLLGVIKDSR